MFSSNDYHQRNTNHQQYRRKEIDLDNIYEQLNQLNDVPLDLYQRFFQLCLRFLLFIYLQNMTSEEIRFLEP